MDGVLFLYAELIYGKILLLMNKESAVVTLSDSIFYCNDFYKLSHLQ